MNEGMPSAHEIAARTGLGFQRNTTKIESGHGGRPNPNALVNAGELFRLVN